MSFRITWRTHVICYILAIVINSLLGDIVDVIIGRYFEERIILYPTHSIAFNFYFQILIILVPITIIHVIIHAAAIKIFGGTVKFGFYRSNIKSKNKDFCSLQIE